MNNLLGSYTYRYLDTSGALKEGRLVVGVPVREPNHFSCQFMIEDQFRSPKSIFARSSFQAVHFAYMRLSSHLKVLVDNRELVLISVRNFDSCSSKRKIDLFDVLATQPDYESTCSRRIMEPGKIDFSTIALEENLNFQLNGSRSTIPITMTLAVPVLRKKLWHCSYFISEVMANPSSVASRHSLNAVTLAFREMYLLLKAKTNQGKFFVRTFHDSRSLEEFDLRLCFIPALVN